MTGSGSGCYPHISTHVVLLVRGHRGGGDHCVSIISAMRPESVSSQWCSVNHNLDWEGNLRQTLWSAHHQGGQSEASILITWSLSTNERPPLWSAHHQGLLIAQTWLTKIGRSRSVGHRKPSSDLSQLSSLINHESICNLSLLVPIVYFHNLIYLFNYLFEANNFVVILAFSSFLLN